jgi:hypothetical protein
MTRVNFQIKKKLKNFGKRDNKSRSVKALKENLIFYAHALN